MPSQHWVPRSLTRSWEDGQRRLHFYDFSLGSIRILSSRRLLAQRDVWSKSLEDFLSQRIESPVGHFLRAPNVGAEPTELSDHGVSDALADLLLTLAARFGAARGSDAALKLLEQLPQDSAGLRAFGKLTRRTLYQVFARRLPPETPLFFPSTGGWFLPLPFPALATSISPSIVVALFHRITPLEQIRAVLRDSDRLMRLSIGKTAFASQVIIPPSLSRDGSELKAWICSTRIANAQALDDIADPKLMALLNGREYLSTAVATAIPLARTILTPDEAEALETELGLSRSV